MKSRKRQRAADGGRPKGLWGSLWRYTLTGLLVWVPLIITLWVVFFVVNNLVIGLEHQIRRLVGAINLIGGRYEAAAFLQHIPYYPGLGVLLAFALFLGTGVLTRYLVGRKLIEYTEYVFNNLPLVNKIYRSVQQIRDVVIGRQGAVFQDVCLVEYPRKGLLTVGFVTARERGLVQIASEKELVAVFVPTTPNPTSGYLIYLPPNELTLLNVTVEEAMKLIVSGGAYLPEERAARESVNEEHAAEEALRREVRDALP